jgi:pyrroloquinoline quinone biosynthesis protein D
MTLETTSRPRLSAGCRWAEPNGADRLLLFPEGAIRFAGTGREILERCDGQRTLAQIVEELREIYSAGDPARIEEDVKNFLRQLHQKRIVDFQIAESGGSSLDSSD